MVYNGIMYVICISKCTILILLLYYYVCIKKLLLKNDVKVKYQVLKSVASKLDESNFMKYANIQK